MTAKVLEVREVTVRFGGITALHDVSLDVGQNEIVGLIGPNGAGKTTLFDVVAGVRKPTSGTVLLSGTDVTNTSAATRARQGIRRTFQRVQTFGWLTVEDNVLLALEWRGGGGGFFADLVGAPSRRRRERERRERARQAMNLCGLGAMRSEPAGALPIGTARLLELARAIAEPPTLLLLDEPTSGLDRTEIERFEHCMQAIVAEHDTSVLVVEHDVSFIMGQCNRVVVLDGGSRLAEGSPADVQANPAVQAAYLGAPLADSEVTG